MPPTNIHFLEVESHEKIRKGALVFNSRACRITENRLDASIVCKYIYVITIPDTAASAPMMFETVPRQQRVYHRYSPTTRGIPPQKPRSCWCDAIRPSKGSRGDFCGDLYYGGSGR